MHLQAEAQEAVLSEYEAAKKEACDYIMSFLGAYSKVRVEVLGLQVCPLHVSRVLCNVI
jgi:hypothetical protein